MFWLNRSSIRGACGVVANVLDREIVVSEFKLHSRYVHFRINRVVKGMKTFILTADLNCTITVVKFCYWITHEGEYAIKQKKKKQKNNHYSGFNCLRMDQKVRAEVISSVLILLFCIIFNRED